MPVSFFARSEFTARPERACHGVLVEVPGRAGPQDIQAALARIGAPASFWAERLPVSRDHPLARRRRDRELSRPVAAGSPPVRVLHLSYEDVLADVAVVAHRRTHDSFALGRLAAALVAPQSPAASQETAASPA